MGDPSALMSQTGTLRPQGGRGHCGLHGQAGEVSFSRPRLPMGWGSRATTSEVTLQVVVQPLQGEGRARAPGHGPGEVGVGRRWDSGDLCPQPACSPKDTSGAPASCHPHPACPVRIRHTGANTGPHRAGPRSGSAWSPGRSPQLISACRSPRDPSTSSLRCLGRVFFPLSYLCFS